MSHLPVRKWMTGETPFSRSAPQEISTLVIVFLVTTGILMLPVSTLAQPPPQYETIDRGQRLEYEPNLDSLMRIWMVYVGQGDGLIIQLPAIYNYSPDTDDDPAAERVDILIDGGSSNQADAKLMGEFLRKLYPDRSPVVEYAVISHHDKDHVLGIIDILNSEDITLQTIYHNGLATYRPGHRNFPSGSIPDADAIYAKNKDDELTRGMAFLDSQGRIKAGYLINNLNQLRAAYRNNDLLDDYEKLAAAVIENADQRTLVAFDRAYIGSPFIIESEASLQHDMSGLEIEVLWPESKLREYESKSWSKSINGNSLTFRLKYGDFEMFFTGDINKASQEAMVEYLRANNREDMLSCDVLKVTHHGSEDVIEDLFGESHYQPAVSVASMGASGFRRTGHRHPRPAVIENLGGPHRVFSTYIHERKFKWETMTEKKHDRMLEKTRRDILIETDGRWFRVVEIEKNRDPNYPPPVEEVRRGHGTRWIQAKEGGQ